MLAQIQGSGPEAVTRHIVHLLAPRCHVHVHYFAVEAEEALRLSILRNRALMNRNAPAILPLLREALVTIARFLGIAGKGLHFKRYFGFLAISETVVLQDVGVQGLWVDFLADGLIGIERRKLICSDTNTFLSIPPSHWSQGR